MIAAPLRPLHVFGYGRVSTDKQVLGIEVQKELVENAFRQLIALQKIPANSVLQWFPDDAVSASVNFYERPAGEAIGLLCKPGDIILAACFDRICRSVADFCHILEVVEREKVILNVLDFGIDTSTSVGQLIGKVMACFKEYEKREVSRRTKEAVAYRKANGLPIASMPWCGYYIHKKKIGSGKYHKTFKPCPDSRRIALYIMDQIDNHGATRRGLVKRLEKEGIRHPTGRLRGTVLKYDWIANAYRAAKLNFPLCAVKDYDPQKSRRMPCFEFELPHRKPLNDNEITLDAEVLDD